MFGTWTFLASTLDGKGIYRKKVTSSAFGISYPYWYLYYDEGTAPEGVLRPRPLDLDNSPLHPHSKMRSVHVHDDFYLTTHSRDLALILLLVH